MRTHVFRFMMLVCFISQAIGGIAHAAETEVDPDLYYFFKGDTPDGWSWVLSDNSNWWLPLKGNEGVSESKKLTMEKSLSITPGIEGAIKLSWNKRGKRGAAIITGRTVDLSRFEQLGALVLVIKLEERMSRPVFVKMTCGDDCSGQVSIRNNLKHAQVNKWFALPIPLDCFVQEGVDLKKVTSPFQIETKAKMDMDIAEISIGRLPAGDQGCMPNEKAK